MGLVLALLTKKPLVLDEHNAEYIRFRRTSSKMWRAIAICERILCRKADYVFVVSEKDMGFLTDLVGDSLEAHLAYNGIDEAVFHPNPEATARELEKVPMGGGPIVLYFGNLSYQPNREALRIIQDEIMLGVKRLVPNVRFVVAGRNPPLLGKANENLFFVGEYPRIEDLINVCQVVICPLISGGGTRLKILESIACGKTVISTTIGAEGLLTEAMGTNLVIVDDWTLFIETISSLLETPRQDSVPPGFLKHYSWRSIVRRQILREIAGYRNT